MHEQAGAAQAQRVVGTLLPPHNAALLVDHDVFVLYVGPARVQRSNPTDVQFNHCR
jgi:hypothetical protein